MAFSRGTVNHRAAAVGVETGRVNPELLSTLKKYHQDIEDIKKRIGAEAVDVDQHAPVSTLPGQGAVAVISRSGRFTAVVTNPEYITTSPGAQKYRNPVRTPVLHRLTFSLNAQFDGQGDVRSYGPSSQTHWSIDDINDGSQRFVGLESSTDGQNWNKRLITGPFQGTVGGVTPLQISGLINGANKLFTVYPVPMNILLFKNGTLLTAPADYALAGSRITMVVAPAGGVKLTAVGSG